MALLNFESFKQYTTSTNNNNVKAELFARGEFDILNYGSFNILTDVTFGKCLRISPGGVSSRSYGRLSASWTVQRSTFNWMVGISPSNGRMSMIDANGVELKLAHTTTGWSLSYNPAGTGDDITASGAFASGATAQVLEFEWKPATFTLFINNEQVYQKSWTGVTGCPYAFDGYWSAGSPLIGYCAHSDGSRIGMLSFDVLTLGTPSVDTGTVTGAASPQLALASFDGDTSYYTVANASGEKILAPVSDLPVTPDAVHGVKITASARKTDSGSIIGSVLLKTGSEATVNTTGDALGYVTTKALLVEDPHTAAAFTESAINSMEIGFKEGA